MLSKAAAPRSDSSPCFSATRTGWSKTSAAAATCCGAISSTRTCWRIEFQVRFQQHLRQHGFPTAEVVETPFGDLFALDDEGVPWVLCTYIEGRECDFGRREVGTMRALRAEMVRIGPML